MAKKKRKVKVVRMPNNGVMLDAYPKKFKKGYKKPFTKKSTGPSQARQKRRSNYASLPEEAKKAAFIRMQHNSKLYKKNKNGTRSKSMGKVKRKDADTEYLSNLTAYSKGKRTKYTFGETADRDRIKRAERATGKKSTYNRVQKSGTRRTKRA
jgi:hypothetical protein